MATKRFTKKSSANQFAGKTNGTVSNNKSNPNAKSNYSVKYQGTDHVKTHYNFLEK